MTVPTIGDVGKAAARRLTRLSDHLYRFQDTCNVYALVEGREAVLIDFGAGDVLDHLSVMGVERVSDVLMTHHHRDQGQGLPRAVAHGARVWVPPVEQDLFHSVDAHWQAREIYHDYNTRQDRFSLLEPVPIAGTLPEYRAPSFGGRRFRVVPTPGHTVGSVSFVTRVDGRKVAFTGDLIYGPGKLWSLAATQWSYTGAEGAGMTVVSLLDLRERRPDVLLPSHGSPMEEPAQAIDLLVARLEKLFSLRGRHPDLTALRRHPYESITPHLLRNRTSVATSYVLRADSGKALLIDYGYDLTTGLPAGSDRAARRPWLATMKRLRETYDIETIDAVVPTHYHDDHVAGMPLLREVLGTSIWAPVNFVDILVNPSHYALPCLWFDPIPVDRTVPLGKPIEWEGFEITFHALPGHTLYAVAIEVVVDGLRALFTGDHQQDRWLNYVYANRFRIGDYHDSGELYQRIAPDVILSGHWQPTWVDGAYLRDMIRRGELLERIHEELLPLDDVDFGAEGAGAWIGPYQGRLDPEKPGTFTVVVRNPFERPVAATVRMVIPDGWAARPSTLDMPLAAHGTGEAEFAVRAPAGLRARRVRIAADVTIDGRPFGQLAEALVDVASPWTSAERAPIVRLPRPGAAPRASPAAAGHPRHAGRPRA